MNRRTFLGTVAAAPVAAVVPAGVASAEPAAAALLTADRSALMSFYGTIAGPVSGWRFKDCGGWAPGATLGRGAQQRFTPGAGIQRIWQDGQLVWSNSLADDSYKTRSDGWWRG